MPGPSRSYQDFLLGEDVPEDQIGDLLRTLAVSRRARRELTGVSGSVEGRGLRLGRVDRRVVRAAIRGLPGCEASDARLGTEGRGVQLRCDHLLQKLHPRLIQIRPFRTRGRLRDSTPEGSHQLPERVDGTPAE